MTGKRHGPVRSATAHDRNDDHAQLRALLRGIADRIDHSLKEANPSRPIGFGLFLFEIGDQGGMFWLSNVERATITAAWEEFVKREGGQ